MSPPLLLLSPVKWRELKVRLTTKLRRCFVNKSQYLGLYATQAGLKLAMHQRMALK